MSSLKMRLEEMNDKISAEQKSSNDQLPAQKDSAHDHVDETSLTQNRQPRKRRNIIVASVIALVLVSLIVYLIFGRAKKTTDEATNEAAVVSVRVAKAEQQTIASEVAALGTIFPREQATVSPKISAPIKQMSLQKNKYVRAGDVIAILESRDLQAQRNEAVAALHEAELNARGLNVGTIPQANAQAERDLRDARANVTNARALYERRRTLYTQGGIALKDVESAQLALTNAEDGLRLAERTATLRTTAINPNDRALAQTRINEAQQRISTLDAQLSYATIRAPISGIITDQFQFQFQGEYVAAGAKLVNIADTSEITVKAPFADEIASQLKTGDAATIVPTDAPDTEMHGQVTLVSRASDLQNRTSEVWVRLGNEAGRLKVNGAAQVRITAKEHQNTVVVPVAAVTLEASNRNEGTVMVVDDGNVAHETKVTTGLRAGDRIEITKGLRGGETIVVEGNYALPDGTKVEPHEDKEDKDKSDKGDEKDDAKDEKSDEKK